MTGRVKITKEEFIISEDVEEVLKKKVTPFGTGAKVGCPKKYLGRTAYLVVCKE
ncbi:transposase [candidate division MSBL1 archaeon SCGC-AAA261C02]|uniref:Transposase n=2 Tax=candidate division MSBL1 TaxID=215777 RepID=A0A133UZ02_9EURY|nr:transposase [candidate division MSBL1 archaeon SCGC-AAA261C02]KXB09512.1 transposase [candidate division MSBL1 archaeon SCGC-AAA833K04]